MKQLPGLDFETCNPKFNIKRLEGKTDEEILAEVEKKVVQMIDNYTHKEWKASQKILKHQGHVNHVLEEMKVPCPPRPKPTTLGKKMQPPDNVRVDTIFFGKTGQKGKERQSMKSRAQSAD
jgi:hypothetical protein